MNTFSSEGLMVVVAVLGFSIIFGIVVWMMPTMINMVMTSLETQVM